MSVTSSDPMIGRLLDGRYRIEARIARGGMATVYTAIDTRLGRSVAVKVMHTGLGSDEDFASRFVREAQSAARLNHPSVVAVFDQGDDDGVVYLVMEYVEGQTLRQLLDNEAPLPPQRAVALLEQILIAVSAAHDAGLVHRDLKPENVLLATSGQVKVADFGLARAVSATTMATATSGVLVGTVSYLAPELVLHQGADARSDVYACGVVLYEMLTGRKPHEGETPIQVAYKHVHEDIPMPSAVRPELPPYLDALVARATARERDLRPADAKVLMRQARRVRNALDQGLRDDRELTEDLLPRAPLADSTVEEPWEPPPLFDDRPMPASGPEHTLVAAPGSPVDPTMPPPPASLPAPPLTARYGQDMSPEGTPQRRKRRRGVIAVIVVVVLAILAGIGGWYLGVGRFTTTPDITGLTLTEATELVEGEGLGIEVVSEEYSETIPDGMIISSDPDGGDRIPDGETVEVVLSIGKERYGVPDVLGETEEQAREMLEERNLVVGKVTEAHNGKYDEGTVAEMSIDPQSDVKPGTSIDLVISTGPVPIRVLDVVGEFAGQAKEALSERGFEVDFQPETTEDVAPNRVIAQAPAGNSTAFKGDVITLTISKPAVEVPNVFMWELQDARRALRETGLKTDVERSDNYAGLGRVGAQDPPAGESVPWGSTITLTIF
ncbi:MAG: Stk1 family PASTA domain-containing Ser/Thr kinase [Nocardioidaceae bacterium]